MTGLLPRAEGCPEDPFAGTVFKIDRGPAGEKIAYVRLFTGSVTVRDRLRLPAGEDKVTGISVFDRGTGLVAVERTCRCAVFTASR